MSDQVGNQNVGFLMMRLIYINFVDIESPMVHAKFQDHGTSGSKDFKKIFSYFWPDPFDEK